MKLIEKLQEMHREVDDHTNAELDTILERYCGVSLDEVKMDDYFDIVAGTMEYTLVIIMDMLDRMNINPEL